MGQAVLLEYSYRYQIYLLNNCKLNFFHAADLIDSNSAHRAYKILGGRREIAGNIGLTIINEMSTDSDLVI